MHGTLGLSSPWCRAAFTDEQRRNVSALIPEGCVVYIAGHAFGRGRSFMLIGRDSTGREVIRLEHRRDVVEMAVYVAERLRELAA